MTNTQCLFFLAFLLPYFAPAQTFQQAVGGVGTEEGFSIIQSSDGGYAVGGYTNSFGAEDAYVVKLSSSGALQWTATVGGAFNDYSYSLIQSSDGGYAMGGYTNSFGAGGVDMYVVKLSSSGALQWTRTVGGAGSDLGYSLIQSSDGGYAVGGYTNSFGAGGVDMYVVKLSSSGALQWTTTVGGTNHESGYSIIQSSDGGYVVGGYTASFGAGGEDVYVAKLSSSGALQWTRTVGGAFVDQGYSIIQSSDGEYVVAGRTTSFGTGSWDMYVVKLSSSGALQWTRTIGGTSTDWGWSIIQSSDGGYAMSGMTISFGAGMRDAYVVKLSSSGALQWTRTIGGAGNEDGNSLIQSSDGGYAVGGFTGSFGTNVYVVKLDSGGGVCGSSSSGGTAGSGGVAGTGGVAGSGGVAGNGGAAGSGGALTTICSGPIILPVELLSFTAQRDGAALRVRCDWSTATEINNNYFEIQRKDGSMEEWKVVGKIQGAGNSSTIQNYTYYDNEPFYGISYYRLRQVDYDGSFSYSQIEQVYIGEPEVINIYPSFSDDEVTIIIYSEQNSQAAAEVFNVLGQKVYRRILALQKGETKLRVPVGGFTAGEYLFRVVLPSREKAQKVFVR